MATGKKVSCALCDELFPYESHLRAHLHSVHGIDRPYLCADCGRAFTQKSQLKVHISFVHSSTREHVCNWCASRFKTLSCLRTHKRRVHVAQRLHVCEECQRSYKEAKHLRRHMRARHPDIVTQDILMPSFDAKVQLADIQDRAVTRYAINKASKSTKTEVLSPKPLSCTITSSTSVDANICVRRKRETYDDVKCFECDQCSSAFTQHSHLRDHYALKHSSDRPYICDQCALCFKLRKALLRHKRQVHSPTATLRYQCRKCIIGTRTFNALVEHIKSAHFSKVYDCLCGRPTYTAQQLAWHWLRHNGQRRFQCTRCDTACADKSQLIHHVKTVHMCERSFQCDQCDKSFVTAHSLKVHSTTHSEERPFECVHCEKSFRLEKFLKRHLKRMHS